VAGSNFAVGTASTNITQLISGLSAITPYWVYSVSEDQAKNQSTPMVSNNTTTSCAPPPAPATVDPSPFPVVTAAGMTVNWVRGTGTGGVIVIAKASSP